MDGGCRGNGQRDAIGAAAAAIKTRRGAYYGYTINLPLYPTPMNQRAEIMSIILGLEKALERCDELISDPCVDVTIYSDSRYAVNCMTNWVCKWFGNGWINSRGNEVTNRDLLEEALDIEAQLMMKGVISYKWIPREKNSYADRLCNERMDEMCDNYSDFDGRW